MPEPARATRPICHQPPCCDPPGPAPGASRSVGGPQASRWRDALSGGRSTGWQVFQRDTLNDGVRPCSRSRQSRISCPLARNSARASPPARPAGQGFPENPSRLQWKRRPHNQSRLAVAKLVRGAGSARTANRMAAPLRVAVPTVSRRTPMSPRADPWWVRSCREGPGDLADAAERTVECHNHALRRRCRAGVNADQWQV